MRNYIVVILVVFTCSCSISEDSEKLSDISVKTIELSQGKIESVFEWENYIDSFEIIPLETTRNSVFSKIHKLVKKGGKYYIFDLKMQSILVFREDGTFSNAISNRGHGPGQYNVIKDFQVDNDNNLILLDYKAIHVYTSDMEHMYTIKIEDDGEVLSFCFFNETNFYTFNNIFPSKSNHLLSHYKQKSISKLFKNEFVVLSRDRFIEHKDGFYLLPPFYNNDIYKINSDSIICAYEITFGDKFCTPEILEDAPKSVDVRKFINSRGLYYEIGAFFDFQNTIYFNYVLNGVCYNSIYSKTNGKVESGKRSLLFHLIPVMICSYSPEENHLIGIIEPHLLKSKKIPEELLGVHPELSFLSNLDETENPLIIKMFLK